MQQFELSEEFVSHLEKLIQANNKEDVAKLVEPLHPADIAEIIEELDTEEAQYLFLLLDEEKAGDVLAEIEEDERQRFIDSFPPEVIAKRFVDNMDSDDAADLVGSMPNEQQQEVLSHMEDLEQAGDIVDLLHYDEDSAGGLMGKELVKVNENWTVLTCLRELSRQAENLDEIFYIYVVDDDNILKGRLSLKKMILTPTSTKIKNIYNPDVTYVTTDESAESVGRIMQKYDLVAIPVVDSIGRLVGRITIDDVVDVIREEAEKDYQMMSGISQDVESSDTVWDQTKARLPWGNVSGIHDLFLRGGYRPISCHGNVYSRHYRHGRKRGYTILGYRGKGTCLQFIQHEKYLSKYHERNIVCHYQRLYLLLDHLHIIPLFQLELLRDANHGNHILIHRDHVRIHIRNRISSIAQQNENRPRAGNRTIYHTDK